MAIGHTLKGKEAILTDFPFKDTRGTKDFTTVVFSIRITKELHNSLDLISAQQGISRNLVISNILLWGVGVYDSFIDLENEVRSK